MDRLLQQEEQFVPERSGKEAEDALNTGVAEDTILERVVAAPAAAAVLAVAAVLLAKEAAVAVEGAVAVEAAVAVEVAVAAASAAEAALLASVLQALCPLSQGPCCPSRSRWTWTMTPCRARQTRS